MATEKCPMCGKEYRLGRKDKIYRRQIKFMSRMFVGLKDITETAKDYCNDCWKDAVLPTVQKMQSGLLGAIKEGETTDEQED